jgi:aminoglycoside phosphotransferase (APT) family kinase protein
MSEDEVRGIDSERVSDWFRDHIDGAKPPLEFSIIVGGHSNITYRVRDAAGEMYVLRRPPLGAVLATAHDMAREHKIISGVGRTDVPVPRALGLCSDESVNGAPFYVMNFVEGVVLENAKNVEANFPLEVRGDISRRVIEVLARLHAIEPDDVGLGDLGRREAYLARQLKRWWSQWGKSKTRELQQMEDVYQALQAKIPEQIGSSIVHGDYRLGNMLTSADGRIAAVLDWELCTLGDPMADVGYLMNNWEEPGEAAVTARSVALPSGAPGFATRQQMLDHYSELTGRDVSGVDYYRAFQYWRLAAIVEGVLARYLKGVMGGKADTSLFKNQVDGLAAAAAQLILGR